MAISRYAVQPGDVLAPDTAATPITVQNTTTATAQLSPKALTANGQQFPLGASHVVSSVNGNALFSAALGTHSGTGAIGTLAITNGEAFPSAAGPFTIKWTSGAAYVVTNAAGQQVAAGSYANPTTIAFLGISVVISGAPVANDTVVITPLTP